ncbi:unnamed protein product [Alopecurus aequalis]
MATSLAAGTALQDLPEDALLAILAFLAPPDAAAAACACRALAGAASSPELPLALALRLGLPPPRPSPEACPASARRLFRSLHRLRRLLGLWRRLPSSHSGSPSLAAFEWAPSATLAASLLTPSKDGLAVSKSPFVTLSIAESGDTVAALGDVPVCVNFVGDNHIVVEAASASGGDEQEGMEGGSPPEEMYMHFANRRSPGAGRRRRERLGRRKGGRMEAEHFVRIPDAEPTKARPLQGLWKGICENRTLEFYLVTYDDIGGVTCRRVSETKGHNSVHSPLFWTTDATFLEPPFSEQELDRYSCCEHIRVVTSGHTETQSKGVSRIMCINSSYDLVDPDLSALFEDTRNLEGRIWLYEDGTFGFGFTGSNSIIDLRHVSLDGCIVDTSY